MNQNITEPQLKTWLSVVIRGITGRLPEGIQVRQHQTNLFIHVEFYIPKDVEVQEPEKS